MRTQNHHLARRTHPSTAHSSIAAPRSVAQRSVHRHPLPPWQVAFHASAAHALSHYRCQPRRCSASRDPCGRCVRSRMLWSQHHRPLASVLEHRRTPCRTHRLGFPTHPPSPSDRAVPSGRPPLLSRLIDATCDRCACVPQATVRSPRIRRIRRNRQPPYPRTPYYR